VAATARPDIQSSRLRSLRRPRLGSGRHRQTHSSPVSTSRRVGQGGTPTFPLGRVRTGRVWSYFPLALLAKWPLGFLGAIAGRTWIMARRRRRRWHECFVVMPIILLLLSAMAVLQLNIGIRYLFPIVPLLCVWLGGFVDPSPAPRRAAGARRWMKVGAMLALLQAVEVSVASPWYLAFYNRVFGGGGRWVLAGERFERRRGQVLRLHCVTSSSDAASPASISPITAPRTPRSTASIIWPIPGAIPTAPATGSPSAAITTWACGSA
jgi:hypothetical protein